MTPTSLLYTYNIYRGKRDHRGRFCQRTEYQQQTKSPPIHNARRTFRKMLIINTLTKTPKGIQVTSRDGGSE